MTTPNWPDYTLVTMDDWGASPTAISGTPHMRGKILSVNSDGSSESGIWSCTPGERTITFPKDEFCYFLDGEGSYVRHDGEVIPVQGGAIVFFPAGWTGRSIVTKTLSKAFMSR
jgi:uncharacterized cupin superfamily protein